MIAATTAAVTSADGTRLATFTSGSGPVAVVAVHGYPDDHRVWDGVVAALLVRSPSPFRVITYDVRGAGASDHPRQRAAYRQERLTDDLVAVIEHAGAPIHLVGHDWGSTQCWPALGDPRLQGRVLSFTSISGPGLDHAAAWLRRAREHAGPAARQLAHSWYTLAFQIPALPELLFRSGVGERVLSAAGVARPRRGSPELVNGPNLYRANMRTGLARPAPPQIDIPVLVLAPARDRFVTVALQTRAPAPYVADLSAEVLAGEHWMIASEPEVIAARVAAFVDSVRAAARR